MANENTNKMTLEEIMSKAPRTSTSIDLTSPSASAIIEENKKNPMIPEGYATPVQPAISTPTQVPVQPAAATVVQTGPADLKDAKSVDIYKILPSRKPDTSNILENQLMNDLDMAIAREKNNISERMDSIFDKQDEEIAKKMEEEEVIRQDAEDEFAINGGAEPHAFVAQNHDHDLTYADKHISLIDESDIASTDEDEDTDTVVAKPNIRSVNILDNVDNSELFDDENDADASASDDDEVEKMLTDLKSAVKEKIIPIKNKINLGAFSIAKKSESVQKVMKLAVNSHRNIADWVLYSENRPVSVTGLSGAEILKLNPENSNRNRLNTFMDMYRIIYDHVYDANKPDYETWLKQVRFVDLQHLYFAVYMATFGGSNFISYTCTNEKCNKVFIKDVKFSDMIKYANDEVKDKVKGMLSMDTTSPSNDSYPVDLMQISDSYVIGVRSPSIWNVVIETASLSDQFLDKYGDLIDIVSYIDSFYLIDQENNTLIPIDTKPDPNNQAKSSARRIKAFHDIISTLSSEEYYFMRANIKEYDNNTEDISYIIPEAVCPDCGTKIPANETVTPDSMLFTRHQLAAIGNM